MKKTKILHLTQALGGVETTIRTITENISTDFESIVVAPKKLEFLEEQEIGTYAVEFGRSINPFIDLKSFIECAKIAKSERPDILHCHSSKAGVLGRLVGCFLGIKTVFTPHAFSFLSTASRSLQLVYEVIERSLVPLTDALIACSESTAEIAIDKIKFPKKKVQLWKNCLASSDFEKVESAGLPFRYICSMGRPSYQKNIEMLISAYSKLKNDHPDLKWVLLGAGNYSPLLSKIEEMISSRGLTDSFMIRGWCSRPEALSIMKGAELVVMSSRYEGLPFTAIEAMGLGKVLIATHVLGTKDIVIDGKTGYLIDSFDCTKMAEKISYCLKNEDAMSKMGEQSRQAYLDEYRAELTIGRLESIYMDVLNK